MLPEKPPGDATTDHTEAVDHWPIDHVEAARRLGGWSVRQLKAHLRKHPCGRRRGKIILFSEQEFWALYASLPPSFGSAAIEQPEVPQNRDRPFPSEAQVQRRLEKLLRKPKRARAPPQRQPRTHLGD
jgi:hypothetical protein